MAAMNDLTRPIMGIENRTPLEVFEIMRARIEGAGVVPFGTQPDPREPINNIITAWLPEQDPHRLAVLGKLAEECNELAGRAVRCIIQGIDEKDPATGRTNRDELAREASDVEACLEMVESLLGVKRITSRVAGKYDGFKRWHRLIEEKSADRLDTATHHAREAYHAIGGGLEKAIAKMVECLKP